MEPPAGAVLRRRPVGSDTAPFNVTQTYSVAGNINTMVDPVRGMPWTYPPTLSDRCRGGLCHGIGR